MRTLDPLKSNQSFYSLDDFPEFKELVSQYYIILEELLKNRFWMNIGGESDPVGHNKALTGNWTICPLYFGNYDTDCMSIFGLENLNIEELVGSLQESFPNTVGLLEEVPAVNFALFARLHAKSSLAPSKHHNPHSLILQIGLIIPPKNTCGIQVGKEVFLWKKAGDAVIFNDNLEHYPWNHSDHERVLLYVDFAV